MRRVRKWDDASSSLAAHALCHKQVLKLWCSLDYDKKTACLISASIPGLCAVTPSTPSLLRSAPKERIAPRLAFQINLTTHPTHPLSMLTAYITPTLLTLVA